jgi:hypothetical protein
MPKLRDIARVVRGKNAGALYLTLDVMFEDDATYKRVRDSGVLSPRALAPLFGVTDNEVAIIPFDVARAIKITVPRRVRSGSAGDTDVYGAQQHVPLMNLDVPE